MADRHWEQEAVKRPGALHRRLGVPEGEPIPVAKIVKAEHSQNLTERREAELAMIFRRQAKARSGAKA